MIYKGDIMSLEKEVMLVYGTNNLKDYKIKVVEFIQDISVSSTSGRTDLTTFAFQNEGRENKLKDKLRARAKFLGANAVTGVKSSGELNSSLSGNAVIIEGEGYDKYLKRFEDREEDLEKENSAQAKIDNFVKLTIWRLKSCVSAIASAFK